jgi:hypothetical protein
MWEREAFRRSDDFRNARLTFPNRINTAMSDDDIRQLPTKDLISEEGAHELATSPEMKPYLDLIIAEMQGRFSSRCF